jgi:hypothetical protein
LFQDLTQVGEERGGILHERNHAREEIGTLFPVPSVASAVGLFPWFAGARMSSISGSRLLGLADLPEP